MIDFKKGNIFTTDKKVIVNTINCVGVMGAGIALECRLRFPDMFNTYKDLCSNGLISPGLLWLYKANSNRWILNFPTKTHWKYPSKEIYVEKGLEKFVDTYKSKNIESIAFPLLGTNNGGLNKDRILEIMCKYLKDCDIPISIYDYDPLANDGIIDNFIKKWKLLSDVDKISIFGKLQFEKLTKVINYNNLSSLISIHNIDKSISINTLEKCYSL